MEPFRGRWAWCGLHFFIFYFFCSRGIVRHATRHPPCFQIRAPCVAHNTLRNYAHNLGGCLPTGSLPLCAFLWHFPALCWQELGTSRRQSWTHTHAHLNPHTSCRSRAQRSIFFFFFSVYNTGRILVICSDSVSFASLITEISGSAATSPAKQTSTV